MRSEEVGVIFVFGLVVYFVNPNFRQFVRVIGRDHLSATVIIGQNNIVALRPCAVSTEPLSLINGAVRGLHYVRVVIVKEDAPNDFALHRRC
jgi:hypothetical protein